MPKHMAYGSLPRTNATSGSEWSGLCASLRLSPGSIKVTPLPRRSRQRSARLVHLRGACVRKTSVNRARMTKGRMKIAMTWRAACTTPTWRWRLLHMKIRRRRKIPPVLCRGYSASLPVGRRRRRLATGAYYLSVRGAVVGGHSPHRRGARRRPRATELVARWFGIGAAVLAPASGG